MEGKDTILKISDMTVRISTQELYRILNLSLITTQNKLNFQEVVGHGEYIFGLPVRGITGLVQT